MSFLITLNGQFKPYTLPDLSHYDRVHHIYKVNNDQEITEGSKFPDISNTESKKKQNNKLRASGINQYKKQEKIHEKQQIPHLSRDIMSKNLKLLFDYDSFSVAQEKLKKFNINHLPVINSDKKLIGMVSDRDLLKKPTVKKVSELMTSEVLTCFDTTRIQDISKIMLHEKISAIPIIDINYELVGIVTKNDILRFMTSVFSIDDII
jgi:predicted transcriptional regulator